MNIDNFIDKDLLSRCEFYSYGHALEILYDAFPEEWKELQECLRKLKLTLADLKKAGGNESPIPKNLMMCFIHMVGEKLGLVEIWL